MPLSRRVVALGIPLIAAVAAACRRKADGTPLPRYVPTFTGEADDAMVNWTVTQLTDKVRKRLEEKGVKFTGGTLTYREMGVDFPERETARIFLYGMDRAANKWTLQLYGRLSQKDNDTDGKAIYSIRAISAPHEIIQESIHGTPDLHEGGSRAYEKASALITKMRQSAGLSPMPVNAAVSGLSLSGARLG